MGDREVARWLAEGYAGNWPKMAESAFVAPGVILAGEVTLDEDANIWYNSVLRADYAPIRIGRASNIQDNCTIHVDTDRPALIGEYVTVGHNAVIHGATIEDEVLIGMNATVLTGAVVGRGSIIGAGALVTENAHVPPGSLVLGLPGKVARLLSPVESAPLRERALRYVELARRYRGT